MLPAHPQGNNLEEVLGHFSREQLSLVMKNVNFFQLTYGCSLGCSFCGFGAEKGVKSVLQFDLIDEITKNFSDELGKSRPPLYGASEPFDHTRYMDIFEMVRERCEYTPGTTTAFPKGQEQLIIDLLKAKDEHRFRPLQDELDALEKEPVIPNTDLFEKEEEEDPDLLFLGMTPEEMAQDAHERQIKELRKQLDDKYCNTSVINRISVSGHNRRRVKQYVYKNFPQLNDQEKHTRLIKPEQVTHLKRFVFKRDACGILFGEKDPNRFFAAPSFNRSPRQLDVPTSFDFYVVRLNNGSIVFSVNEPVTYRDIIASRVGVESYDFYFARYNQYKFFFGEPNHAGNINEPVKIGEKNIDQLTNDYFCKFNGAIISPTGIFNFRTVKPSRECPGGKIVEPIVSYDFKVVVLDDREYNEVTL